MNDCFWGWGWFWFLIGWSVNSLLVQLAYRAGIIKYIGLEKK